MTTMLRGEFDTRRQAEMTVERLVQEHKVDRQAIMVAATGFENSAGIEQAGSDSTAGAPSGEARDDAALAGRVMVLVKLGDPAQADTVRSTFAEFAVDDVDEK